MGLLLSLLSFSWSCEDALETKVYGEVVPEAFFKNEADLKAAVTGISVYIAGRGVGTDYPLYTSHVLAPFVASMLSTDELNSLWWDGLGLWTWNHTANAGFAWEYVSHCAKITELIARFEEVTSVDRAVVDKYIAELRGVRAQYMYLTYLFFGPTNVKLDPATLTDETPTPRLSDAEFRKALEADLNAVLESDMIERQEKGSDDWGRVSKDYFRMLAVRYYMHIGNWSQAEKYCREIIASGAYELEADYNDAVSKQYNKEVIFSCPADTNHGNIWLTECCPGSGFATQGPGAGTRFSGWYGIYMPWEHYHKLWGESGDASFDNDARRATVHDEYKFGNGAMVRENPSAGERKLTGAIPVKFSTWHQFSFNEFPIEQPVYRLAEVYLTLAECIVRQQNTITSEAESLVADIRERAGLGRDLTANLVPGQVSPMSSADAFIEFLLWERGRELYCEGQRREDLLRYGMFVQRAYDQHRISDVASNEYRVLYPIPNSVVLQGNGVIEQNPGYTSPF